MQEGQLIIFEGGEFTGKSTQVKKLVAYLRKKGYKVLKTKEPGGGIRNLRSKIFALDSSDPDLSNKELALFEEDRQVHYDDKILPALENGDMVVCDRGRDSTIAYQGYGRARTLVKGQKEDSKKFEARSREARDVLNLRLAKIRKMNEEATGGRKADLTILLDMNPYDALKRARNEKEKTRFDREPLEFHEKIKMGFLNESVRDTEMSIKKWQVIWADDDPEVITQKIIKAVETRLGL